MKFSTKQTKAALFLSEKKQGDLNLLNFLGIDHNSYKKIMIYHVKYSSKFNSSTMYYNGFI